MKSEVYDVCISGSGAVARALALALAMQGWKVALACEASALEARPFDVRTYALNARSIALLDRLKVWSRLQAHATAVHDMAVTGDAGARLGFSAWQQCVQELAWIVDASALEQLLGEALRFSPHVTVVPPIDGPAGAPQARLLAICEGKHSATRQSLGVNWRRQDYGHWGVAARLKASRPHQGVARQWFRSPDILALLPFHAPEPGASYGLVWSVPEARARELLALPAQAFTDELARALRESDPESADQVGSLSLDGTAAGWPLALSLPDRWCGPGWVLLGDAAHQVHPLAGQGLNLGFGDVEALAAVLAQARHDEPWRSPGDERLLRRFVRQRWWPTQAMAGLTDGLLHLFSRPGPVARELRNRGMTLIHGATPVKRWLIGQALDR